jgi:hypothetical protein
MPRFGDRRGDIMKIPLKILTGMALALMLAGCSDSTDPVAEGPGPETTAGYPEVPRPSGPNDFDGPDKSEVNWTVVPLAGKEVDFAPYWTAGTFTWDVDIQTQYESFGGDGWRWTGDDPGHYWNGTRHTSQMVFEGGVVNLTNPTPFNGTYILEPTYRWDPIPKRLIFFEDGSEVAAPYNPMIKPSSFNFQFAPVDGTPDVYFNPGIFVAHWELEVENGFNQRNKRRAYYVGIRSAPKLTNEVYLMRERFWVRVLVDGTKSVRVDEGASKSVAYTRTTGTARTSSYDFAEATDVTAQLTPFDVGLSVSHTITETFSESVEVSEEESEEVTHTVTGLTGKTVIFSVWESVEQYSFTDAEGNPYIDPNYTFDLAPMPIRGDHEVLQSAIFDAETK